MNSSGLQTLRLLCVAAMTLVLSFATQAHAQVNQLPESLQGVEVDEHMLAQVPRDLIFRNHTGAMVRLGDLFDGRRPLVLNLVYHRCPRQCSLVLGALIQGLVQTAWTVGDQFDVVTLSIDPLDTPEIAAGARAQTLSRYPRPAAQKGWHFLVGTEANIRAVTEAVGWKYKFEAWRHEYSHPAAIMLLTPDGRVARYLYGITYRPNDLRLGLLEASEGRSITTTEKVLLYCFHYDPSKGKYVIWPMRVMQLAGFLTIAIVGTFLSVLWIRDRARQRAQRESNGANARRDADTVTSGALGGLSQPVVKR